jgi:hypothetical protein
MKNGKNSGKKGTIGVERRCATRREEIEFSGVGGDK